VNNRDVIVRRFNESDRDVSVKEPPELTSAFFAGEIDLACVTVNIVLKQTHSPTNGFSFFRAVRSEYVFYWIS
jgi:hypothetical protein